MQSPRFRRPREGAQSTARESMQRREKVRESKPLRSRRGLRRNESALPTIDLLNSGFISSISYSDSDCTLRPRLIEHSIAADRQPVGDDVSMQDAVDVNGSVRGYHVAMHLDAAVERESAGSQSNGEPLRVRGVPRGAWTV